MKLFLIRIVFFCGCFSPFLSFPRSALCANPDLRQIRGRVVDFAGVGLPNIELDLVWSPEQSPNSSLSASVLVHSRTGSDGRIYGVNGIDPIMLPRGGVTRLRVTTPASDGILLRLANGLLLDPLGTGGYSVFDAEAPVEITANYLCSNSPQDASFFGSCSNIYSIAGECWACTQADCQQVLCPYGATGEANPDDNLIALAAAEPTPGGGGNVIPHCTITLWTGKDCPACIVLKKKLGCNGTPEDCKKNIDANGKYSCLKIEFKDASDPKTPGRDELVGKPLPLLVIIDPATGEKKMGVASEAMVNAIAASDACKCGSRCKCTDPKNGSAECTAEKTLKGLDWADEKVTGLPNCNKPEDCADYAKKSCTPTPTPSPTPEPTPTPPDSSSSSETSSSTGSSASSDSSSSSDPSSSDPSSSSSDSSSSFGWPTSVPYPSPSATYVPPPFPSASASPSRSPSPSPTPSPTPTRSPSPTPTVYPTTTPPYTGSFSSTSSMGAH